jgi:hypothetical protein
MKTEPFDKRIPCTLTPAEFILKSKALAEAMHRQAEIAMAKALANEGFKTRTKSVIEEIKVLQSEVHSGQEYREVQCIERPDWQEGMVETVRMDDGTPVSRRPMLPEERQQKLRLEDEHKRAEKKRKGQPSVLGPEKPELEAGKTKKQKPDNDNAQDEPDEFKRGLQ